MQRVGDRRSSHHGNWAVGEEWEVQRGAIQELYLNQNQSLKQVMDIMAEKHGFHAT